MMTPAPATALPADMLQSVRSSCDRCRLFKLKCAVPTDSDGPVACERCTRAKVPCIFGRRRRATRSNDGHKRQQQRQQQQPTPIPPSSTSPVLPLVPASHPTSADLVGTIVSSVPDVPIHVTAAATTTITGATLSAWDWPPQHGSGLDNTYMLDCTNNLPGGQQQPAHRGLWDWPPTWYGHHGGGTEDMDPYLCLNTSNPTDPSQQGGISPSSPFVAEGTPPATVRPTTAATTDEGLATSSGCPSTSNNSASGEHLLALIADMQQALKMLEEGSWRNSDVEGDGSDNNNSGSVPSLDDYPLGTVLNISQEFSAIAASVLKRVRAAEAAAMSPAPSSTTTKNESGVGVQGPGTPKGTMTGGLASVDMATMVLILGGYMWLSHMYSVVLGHFQQHLSRIPLGGGGANPGGACGQNNNHHHHPNFHLNTIPSMPPDKKNSCNNPYPIRLKLGELSCSSAAPDLGRIHNALSMLLAAMRGVEDQLGRGGAVVRNLVLARLSHDALLAGPGGLVEGDGFGGLEWRVKLVKELLRERMGL